VRKGKKKKKKKKKDTKKRKRKKEKGHPLKKKKKDTHLKKKKDTKRKSKRKRTPTLLRPLYFAIKVGVLFYGCFYHQKKKDTHFTSPTLLRNQSGCPFLWVFLWVSFFIFIGCNRSHPYWAV
jgi:hypothetical protein